MSAPYDPLRLPEGGRSVPCGLCEQPVLLALDNPRRVCAGCGNVNLPVEQRDAANDPSVGPRLAGLQLGAELRTAQVALARLSPVTVLGWLSFGCAHGLVWSPAREGVERLLRALVPFPSGPGPQYLEAIAYAVGMHLVSVLLLLAPAIAAMWLLPSRGGAAKAWRFPWWAFGLASTSVLIWFLRQATAR